MSVVLKKSDQISRKGQQTRTDSNQSLSRQGTTTATQGPRTDEKRTSSAVRMQIEFTLAFTSSSPVTPEGETEPNPGC